MLSSFARNGFLTGIAFSVESDIASGVNTVSGIGFEVILFCYCLCGFLRAISYLFYEYQYLLVKQCHIHGEGSIRVVEDEPYLAAMGVVG